MTVKKSPILFLGFNRPQLAEAVFESIRAYQPTALFIAVDGPRDGVPSDVKSVERMKAYASQVNWNCKVHTLFRDDNKGCQDAVTEALNWFFDHVEQGIILEDDCVPDPSFFTFCDTMLERYHDDKRVMSVSGESYPGTWLKHCDASYSFSSYALIWGWATWRRAWKLYDGQMKAWHENLENGWMKQFFPREAVYNYWLEKMSLTHDTPGFTWDYQWVYSSWQNSGLCIIPNRNLITNIGCGVDATHTVHSTWQMANREIESIKFPLRHPEIVKRDFLLDESLEKSRWEIADTQPEAACERPPSDLQSSFSTVYKRIRAICGTTLRRMGIR